MNRFFDHLRALNPRLRTMLIATALLIVPQIGQFVAIHDINTTGRESSQALLFLILALFTVPTSLILTSAIFVTVRHHAREQERTIILGGLNLLIALSLTWFVVNQCSWSQVFGVALRGCR